MEIKQIREVSRYIDHAVDIVFFDIDNTILEPDNSPGLPQWANAFEKHIRLNKQIGELSDEDFGCCMQKLVTNHINTMKPAFVEPEVLSVIHKIAQQNIPIIAITNRPLDTVEITSIHLKQLGIDLSVHPFKQKVYDFDSLKRPAVLNNGVITCNGNHKGQMIAEFLKRVNFTPKKLVFIDDSKDFVREVEEQLCGTETEVIGLRYGFLDEKVSNFKLTRDMIPENLL